MSAARVRSILAGALLAVGAASLAQGAWIHAKAGLAQVLMSRAWRQARDGESKPRPWPWADTWPVARLLVPRVGADLFVLAGATGRTLAFGPALVDGSAAPGETGHTVLTGHRDTSFRFLEGLRVGDELLLEDRDGVRHRFVVDEIRVAHVDELALDLDPPAPRLSLVTCYPFDAVRPGGPLRWIVSAHGAGTSAS